jgi:hypothetical protein
MMLEKRPREGEYAELDGYTRSWLSRFRQAGVATARPLLALWHRLLDNFKLSKPCGGVCDGKLPRIITGEAGNVACSSLYRPHRRLALDLDNCGGARGFHQRSQKRTILLLWAFVIGAILVIRALAISPAVITEKHSILPNSETKSLSVKASQFEDVSILGKGPENQANRPSMVFIDDTLIEDPRQPIDTELLLRPEPKITLRACSDARRLQINDAPIGKVNWTRHRSGPQVFGLRSSGIFEDRYDFDPSAIKWLNCYLFVDKCPKLHDFCVIGDISLPSAREESENCYAKSNLFEMRVLLLFSVLGAASGIAGLWLIFFGVNRNGCGCGWRLGTLLTASAALIVFGWISQMLIPLPIAIAESASVFCGFSGASAPRYRGAEDVRIATIIIAPFKFGDIQRQIFTADFVKAAHDTSFQQRPKAINRLSVDRAVNILTGSMPNSTVFFQLAVSGIFVGRDQAHFLRNGFADEAVQRFSIGMRDDTGHDIAIALYRADNGILAFSAGPWRALIPMPVPVLAANISFVNFDNANQFTEIWIGKPSSDAMAHIMRCRVGTETKHPLHLQCGYAFLASQHEIDDFEPNPQRDICVFKDRADQDGKAISLRRTGGAFPFEGHSFQCIDAVVSAVWAMDAIWPTMLNEIRFASGIVGEQFIKLNDGHLFGEFWGGHGSDLLV